jgi:transposase
MKLYGGVDLHSNNGLFALKSQDGKTVFRKRLRNDLKLVLSALEPFREDLEAIAVESTYNWYWLVDGLMEAGYPVRLANPAAVDQYDGLKNVDDDTEATFLAELLRLDILPEGYIYPKEERSVRDLLRRRMLFVEHRTAMILSLQSLFSRETGGTFGWRAISKFDEHELERLLGGDEYLLFTATQQFEIVRFLCQKIGMLERKALESAKLKPEYEKLLKLPGVGMILALTIMYETGDIGRFRKAGNYTSYCRCAGASRVSNGKRKGENNRRNGNRYLCWAYVEAVHHALRCCPPAQSFYNRKKAKSNGAVATKALASKWTKAAYHVLKRQEDFDIRRVFG